MRIAAVCLVAALAVAPRALADSKDWDDCIAGDPNVAFVTKPWTVSDMLARVRALLDRPAGGAG